MYLGTKEWSWSFSFKKKKNSKTTSCYEAQLKNRKFLRVGIFILLLEIFLMTGVYVLVYFLWLLKVESPEAFYLSDMTNQSKG